MKYLIIGLLVLGSISATLAQDSQIPPNGVYECKNGESVSVFADHAEPSNPTLKFSTGGSRGTKIIYKAKIDYEATTKYRLQAEVYSIGAAGDLALRNSVYGGYIWIQYYNHDNNETFDFRFQEARITYRSSNGRLTPLWNTFDWENSHILIEGCKKAYDGCAGGNCRY
jgi:hypothetical protein